MSAEILEGLQNEVRNYEEDFKKLSQKICMMFATEGVYRKPYLDGLPYFSVLDEKEKNSIVEHLRFYCELCEAQISEGFKLRDNLSFTWRAFRKLDLIPRGDIFSHMTDEDLIEIYSCENKQLYRNFKFFEFCSYTLEELHSLEWWTLYERDSEITMKIFDAGSRVAAGEITESYVPDIQPHRLREVKSAECSTFLQQVKLMSPLKRNKKVEAILVVESATPMLN